MTDRVGTSGGVHDALAAASVLAGGLRQLSAAPLWALGVPGQDGTGTPGAWLRAIAPTLRPGEAAALGKQAETLYRSRLAPELEPTRVALEAGEVRTCQASVVTETIGQLSPPNVPAEGQRGVDAHQLAAAQASVGADQESTPAPTSPAKVIVRVTAETLAAAVSAPLNSPPPVGLQPAELDDGSPLSRAALARTACDADLVPILLDDLGQPLDVGRTQRLFTVRQRVAIAERDRHCTWPGCAAPAPWCNAHHLVYWEQGGRSDLDNAALLCGRHHRRVHANGVRGQVIDGHVLWHDSSAPAGIDPPDPADRPGDSEPWPTFLQRLCRQWLTPERQ